MLVCCYFFFKQKTAYELRISDWSSDVCSSDLPELLSGPGHRTPVPGDDRAGQGIGRGRLGLADHLLEVTAGIDVHGEDRAEVLGAEHLVARVGPDHHSGPNEPADRVVIRPARVHEIGSANVRIPDTNAKLILLLLIDKNN